MKKIAQSSADLTVTNGMLADDQAYLKELTEVCNVKSKMWDQRSRMRQDELTALTTALNIINERVADKTPAAGLVQRGAGAPDAEAEPGFRTGAAPADTAAIGDGAA